MIGSACKPSSDKEARQLLPHAAVCKQADAGQAQRKEAGMAARRSQQAGPGGSQPSRCCWPDAGAAC